MLDAVLKLIGLGGFVAFLAILGIYVPEWNLLAILVAVALMAAYDFFIRPLRLRNGSGRRGGPAPTT